MRDDQIKNQVICEENEMKNEMWHDAVTRNRKKNTDKIIWTIILGVLIVIAMGGIGYLLDQL